VGRFGTVRAVVNNASMFEHDEVASFSYATLERHLRANTAPAIVLARALHAQLPDGTQGVVVNLLDQKLANPNPDHLSYTLSKAALESATTMLAMALAPRVRVVGVAPGLTLHSGPMTDAEFETAHRMTPLQRSSTPEDVARAVRFLMEAPAITGTTLLVDGGQHLQAQPRDVLFLAQQALHTP
jgi:NAD(P)-dependent dehydrogenase (short-subunit alcohol dehydrogenase family)